MRKFWPQISFTLLLLAAVIALACGSSTERILQSITISPATAEEQAQFTATGYFTTHPSPVTPFAATWGACAQEWEPTSAVSISSSGLAQCSTGASGTFTIFAYGTNTGPVCDVALACGPPCGSISSTAKLTCP